MPVPVEPARHALRVMESFGPPHPRTNPYLRLLVDSLPGGADPGSTEVLYFSWAGALRGDYDVFHVHWPEVLVRGTGPLRSVVRGMLFGLLLVRLRFSRRALVRTLHNEEPHERPNALQRWLLALCDRWTTLWIVMSDAVGPVRHAPEVVIPHGHYRPWFEDVPLHPAEPGRLLHFGKVRPYKGVEQLLDAFEDLDDPALSLHVAGEVSDDSLRRRLTAAAASDPRIRIVDRHLSDGELAEQIHRSELVVLPFTSVTNSGSTLLALSLDRPVLTPRQPMAVSLAEEVGGDWVRLFDAPLRADDVRAALTSIRTRPAASRPDLSVRDWPAIGAAHASAFSRARELAR